MKNEYKPIGVVDITKLVSSPAPGPQMAKVMRKGGESMYFVCLFHGVEFRELVEEHELTPGILPWILWSCCSANFHLLFEAVART